MMNNPYDLHSWSKQYREERLAEAEERTLIQRLRVKYTTGRDGLHQGKEVLSMRRIVLIFMVAAMMVVSMAFSASAFASHEHYLETRGTCVEDVARGQTAKDEGDPGGHKFHENVHKGQPGTEAFEKENNPVSVDKGSCPAEQ